LLLIAWLYAPILSRLYQQWVNDQNFSHGRLVPLFSFFLLWKYWPRIRTTAQSPSWVGLAIIVSALLILVVGVLGAELFSSRVSLLILLAGLIVLFWGWPMFRTVFFPWAFLILMIPIPQLLLQKITFPLQLLASRLAAVFLEVTGVPVFREGNILHIPVMDLEVVQACSGVRSLLSLVTLAIIYGYLLENRQWVRVALVLWAVPIAVVANSFRIVGTGLLVQYWDPDKAKGFFHTFEGWLIFVVSLVLLFGVHAVINRIWRNVER